MVHLVCTELFTQLLMIQSFGFATLKNTKLHCCNIYTILQWSMPNAQTIEDNHLIAHVAHHAICAHDMARSFRNLIFILLLRDCENT